MTEGSSATASIVKTGAVALKFLGVALLLYIGGIAIYAYSQFSSTKTKLLTYGLNDATGNLLAYTVMLVALALPVMAVVHFFKGSPRPRDWVAAMALPLMSWGMAQLPANFDATTGEALKYCAKRPSGELFCLDRPGVDPLTQRPLKKMDAELAEREIRKRDNLMPRQVTLPVSKIEFFDSLSDPSKPEPKVWVVEDGRGCYTLFDHPGVDPTTGDQLKPVTKQIVREIKKCAVSSVDLSATGSSAQAAAQPAPIPAVANVGPNVTAPPATAAAVQPAPAAANTAELDRQRREAAAEAQRRLQTDLAELTRTRDQESRAAESEYRQAELAARNARSSTQVELQRRHQQEQTQARTSCDLQGKAVAKLGALGALVQGGCQQTQNDVEARFQQGNLDIEANFQAALKSTQDVRVERLSEIRDRFERTRAELAQAPQR